MVNIIYNSPRIQRGKKGKSGYSRNGMTYTTTNINVPISKTVRFSKRQKEINYQSNKKQAFLYRNKRIYGIKFKEPTECHHNE